MMAKAYFTSYKLPVITTRGNNVYGPQQFPEKLIPKFALLASRGEKLPLHGDGELHGSSKPQARINACAAPKYGQQGLCACPGAGGATRSYLYVEDVAEAFDIVLHKGTVGETYNIGTQKERTVREVANDIAQIFGLPANKITNVRDRAFNDRRLVAD